MHRKPTVLPVHRIISIIDLIVCRQLLAREQQGLVLRRSHIDKSEMQRCGTYGNDCSSIPHANYFNQDMDTGTEVRMAEVSPHEIHALDTPTAPASIRLLGIAACGTLLTTLHFHSALEEVKIGPTTLYQLRADSRLNTKIVKASYTIVLIGLLQGYSAGSR